VVQKDQNETTKTSSAQRNERGIMKKIARLTGLFATAAICAWSITSSQAALQVDTKTWSASSGSLAASATFTTWNDGTLTVLLQNTSAADAAVPTDILTALFWDPRSSLTPLSAVLGPGSTVKNPPSGYSGPDLGSQYAFKAADAGSVVLGASSIGSGYFGPGDLFPHPGGTINASQGNPPDGLPYGITSASDTAGNDNGGVSGTALVKNSVLFTFSIAGGVYDLSQVNNVSFQYGTQIGENVLVPEPTTMIAGALLLLPFGASTLRILRRNRTA
jgi:hypothetical protein